MPDNFLYNIIYFIKKFGLYGALLGFLFGTLTLPLYGTFFGLIWGLAAGLFLGILSGISITFYNRRNTDLRETDFDTYQNNLTTGAGVITTIVMAVPLLFLYAPIAGLTASYMMHQYADEHRYGGKRKNDLSLAYDRRIGVINALGTEILRKGRWVVFAGIPIATLVILGNGAWTLGFAEMLRSGSYLLAILIAVTGAAFYGFPILAIIAATNGLLIKFLNRIYFDPDLDHAAYKWRVVVIISLFTLWISAVVTAGIGAPLMAIAAGFAAAAYADWYYDVPDKLKIAATDDDYAHLEDAYSEPDDFGDNAESIEEQHIPLLHNNE